MVELGIGVAVGIAPRLGHIGNVYILIHRRGVILIVNLNAALAGVTDEVVNYPVYLIVVLIAVGGECATIREPIVRGDIGIDAEEHIGRSIAHGADLGLIGVDVEVVLAVNLIDVGITVENGSAVPVAVEGEERDGEVNVAVEHYEAVDIDAVCELSIKGVLDAFAEANGQSDGAGAMGGNGDIGASGYGAVGSNVPVGIGEPIGVLSIHRDGSRVLGEDGGSCGVAQGGVAIVHDIERKRVNADLIGVVAKLKLGTAATVNGDIGVGGDGLLNIHDARTLRTRTGAGDGVCGAHQKTVDHIGFGSAGELRPNLVDVVGEYGHGASDMRGAHRGAGHLTVGRGCAGEVHVPYGVNVVAGRGYLGLELEVWGRAVAGEIHHIGSVPLGAGNAETLGVGGGRSRDAVIWVHRKRVGAVAGAVVLRSVGGTVVADSGGDIDAVVSQHAVNLVGIGILGGVAAGGAEAQVDRVNAEVNAILKRRKDGAPGRAAVVAEHLHDNELRVLRNAGVSGTGIAAARDTRNVGAVVGAAVPMRNVGILARIVKLEGDLAAVVDGVRGKSAAVQPLSLHIVVAEDGGDGVGGELLILWSGPERIMSDNRAGVNDRDSGALAGVARCPCVIGIDITDGSGEPVRLGLNGLGCAELGSDIGALYLGEFVDLRDESHGNVDREAVIEGRVAEARLQLLGGIGHLRDLLEDGLLLQLKLLCEVLCLLGTDIVHSCGNGGVFETYHNGNDLCEVNSGGAVVCSDRFGIDGLFVDNVHRFCEVGGHYGQYHEKCKQNA